MLLSILCSVTKVLMVAEWENSLFFFSLRAFSNEICKVVLNVPVTDPSVVQSTAAGPV
jgi:hypothetical protein